MNDLAAKYPEEIHKTMAKYPPEFKRSAVMPLLYLAQRETGSLTQKSLQDVAEICEISVTDVASIVGFYTLYHDTPAADGKYRLQVCTDLPCALRGAEQFLEKLCENLAITVGQTTPDGLITVEAVTCLAGCHRAPLFQVQSGNDISYHEDQTIESAMQFVDELRRQDQQQKEVGG
ncbi:MAG: NAD(P)H-dependent oxidoreductase subunit E [Anaerolineaceae bacterium]|nr:NAD(P)H-dependent oxidoreductase subunit E [Anaerolineaceae bacterium]